MKVLHFMNKAIEELIYRAEHHDDSKLEKEEIEYFDEYTPKLKDCTYGSEQYKDFLIKMKPALDHHYANNRHHPEHFKNGIEDMNLIDLLEMLCDWKASSLRHVDGNILKSIDGNRERFNYGKELQTIFENTVKMFEE
jgi:hypothetical protein